MAKAKKVMTLSHNWGGAIASILLVGLQPVAAGEITWSVENNFRLLPNSKDQDWIKNIAIQSRYQGSANIRINDLGKFWKQVPDTPYNSELGTYDPEYINPTQWLIRLSLSSAPYGSQCQWSVGNLNYQASCHDFVPNETVGKGPTKVRVKGPLGETASTQIKISDVLFAVLGDSWISGEGNPDVFQDRQIRERQWWDRKCHRSLYAWPILAAARYAVDNAKQSVTIISRACSGAVLSDLLNIPGQEYDHIQDGDPQFRPRLGLEKKIRVAGSLELKPQIAQLSKDLCLDNWQDLENGKGEGDCKGKKRKPDFIFLSIGGNDAKFAPLVINALALKINEGIELKDGSKRRETLIARIVKPLLVFAKSEIEDYKNEAAKTVKYLEKYYPKMGERLNQSFQGVPVFMALYPDPLHGEPTTFCGRKDNQELWTRDDGIQTVDFTQHGIEDTLANMLKRRITNAEVTAIHDDFYSRFVGREPLPLPENNPDKSKEIKARNYDYRGLLSIAKQMENQYPGLWRVVQTSRYYPSGEAPRDYQLNNEKPKDVDQLPGFHIRGYCVSGTTSTGRWFNTISDSIERQGELTGAMHPNIFGQLYYTSKIYDQLTEQRKLKSLLVSDQNPKCPSLSRIERKRGVLSPQFGASDDDNKILATLKEDAKNKFKKLLILYPAYENAWNKYTASRKDRLGHYRYAQPAIGAGQDVWGTSNWGRRADLEYPEIATYNKIFSKWRKKMELYEEAYMIKMHADQAHAKEHAACTR